MDAAGEPRSSVDRGAIEPYRRWASVFFTLLVVVVTIGLVVVLSTPGALDPGSSVGIPFLNGLLGLAVLVAATLGLSTATTWALHAVAPICSILILYGCTRSVVALSGNGVLIPLEAMGALLVLSRPHATDILPVPNEEDRRKVTLAAVMFALTSLVSLLQPLA